MTFALACVAHSHREFMSGRTDWAQTVADGRDAADYRSRVTDSEGASMWQSLASPPDYKSGYCVAVCPAGEDVLGPYLDDRKTFMDTVLRPLRDIEFEYGNRSVYDENETDRFPVSMMP